MNHPEYKNRAKRLATWKQIAEEMGSGNADIWSAKWKGLKDNYAKFKKSTEPPYSESYKKYKKWPWSEHVRFLDECSFTSCRRVKHQPGTATNTGNSIVDGNPEESNDTEPELTENKTKRRRRITEPFEEDQGNHKIKKTNKPPPDGVDQFFLSYAQSFKKLPSRMQIMLKLEIATLFTRYELQANGVAPDSVHSIPRIVPHPVKSEFDFTFDIDE